jgi:hypothetical protein
MFIVSPASAYSSLLLTVPCVTFFALHVLSQLLGLCLQRMAQWSEERNGDSCHSSYGMIYSKIAGAVE